MQKSSHGQAVAIGVKAHVLYSELLTPAHYWALLNLKSTTEIGDFLRQTDGYRETLQKIPSAKLHRVNLEKTIRASLLSEAASFLPYLSGGQRKLFVDWLGWFEAEHIKTIFRWIRSRDFNRDTIRSRLEDVPGSKLSYDLLLSCRDYQEALEALKDTKYYETIKEPVSRLVRGEDSLFSFEHALDNFIEKTIFDDIKELSKDDRETLIPLFGARIDLINLYHFHRCTWYYSMTPEETLSHMLPVKYKVTSHKLREMNKEASWQERLDKLEEAFPQYGRIFKDALNETDKELALEVAVKRSTYLKSLSVFRKGTPGFHTVMAYFLLKSQESEDIIRIIEDVRYDYDRRIAAGYLVRPIFAGGESSWQ
ncbi:MAG: V-type ATPase subunit [Synergistaceae bacterium]